MRKRLYYLPFLVMAFASLIFLCKPVFAVPLLQLDISDGVYDQGTQTIVATDSDFTLYALLANKPTSDGSFTDTLLADPFYISVALVPMTEETVDPLNLGSFDFDGNTVDVIGHMSHGTPPGLPPHGIFPTYFAEFSFMFEGQSVNEYNTQDNPGGFGTGTDPTKIVYWAAFDIDTSGLDPDYAIHFDLYHYGSGVDYFAPFSHDAQSRVPEPSTMLLLGSGLIGLGVLGRKKLFKRG